MLLMGGEVYDDPMQLIASLPERVLLSDFVESMHQVTEAVLMVSSLVAGLLMGLVIPGYEARTLLFVVVTMTNVLGVGLGQ